MKKLGILIGKTLSPREQLLIVRYLEIDTKMHNPDRLKLRNFALFEYADTIMSAIITKKHGIKGDDRKVAGLGDSGEQRTGSDIAEVGSSE